MNVENISVFLPKYLSATSEAELFSGLKDFPNNIDDRIFTRYLEGENVIYQGDGIIDIQVYNPVSLEVKNKECIVLSNTCDIAPENKRNFPSNIVYAPIIKLDDYVNIILSGTSKTKEQIESHLSSIRKQRITQIFYLPQYGDKLVESIVFLDKLYNLPISMIDRGKLRDTRLFSLSNYGIYLFLYKISIHFTRIQDRVDRKGIRV